MTALNGRWRMVRHENLEAYYNQIKTPEKYRNILQTLMANLQTKTYVVELNVDKAGGNVFRKVYIGGEKMADFKIPIGVETDVTGTDGRPLRGKLEIIGDDKMTIHEKGDDYVSNVLFQSANNEMIVTFSSGSVAGRHFYVPA